MTSTTSTATPIVHSPTIPVVAFGMGLSAFFAISFVVCVLGYLALPDLPIPHSTLSLLLPGFKLLSWPSFLLGLFESIAFGWYVALIFAPLYNYFVRKLSR